MEVCHEHELSGRDPGCVGRPAVLRIEPDRAQQTPRLSLHAQAGAVRQRIKGIVVRNSPQVMVKVTGGGRGMAAIAAHLRYISKSGRLPFEDDRGEVREGREALCDLSEQWRCGGNVAAGLRLDTAIGDPECNCQRE